jgi:magnesium-transporting ATPase (P-type)
VETETHQDCLCSLAKHIGHTEKSYQQYRQVKQLWNIKRNQEVRKKKEDLKRNEVINKGIGGFEQQSEKNKREYFSANESVGDHNELVFDMDLSEVDSADDAGLIQNNPLIFVDYKMMRILEKKRQANFCHILTSIVLDVQTAKY